ncbi:MAG: hypothetical protein ACK4NT_02290, partial [Candidatus Omnitrophota bacterium]
PIQFQLYPIFTLIFYFCLILYFLKPHYRAIIFGWLSFPILFYLFFTFEDFPRHTLPVLPATGLVIAYVLNHFLEYINIDKNGLQKIKQSLIAVLFIFCIFQFLLISYKEPKDNFTTLDFAYRIHRTGMLHPNRFAYSPVEEIVALLAQESKEKRINIGLDIPTEFNNFLKFEIIKKNFKNITCRNLLLRFDLEKNREGKFKIYSQVEDCDYLLIPEPIEKYSDALLSYEQLINSKFRHQLSFFYAFFLREKNEKISFPQAKKLFFKLAHDIEKYKNNFELIQKITLPRNIFKSPYPRLYYLYRKINYKI